MASHQLLKRSSKTVRSLQAHPIDRRHAPHEIGGKGSGSKTRGLGPHFSLLRSSRGKLKNETKPVPLSGRKVTLGRRGNIGKEPDTAIPPCPDKALNTNLPTLSAR